ncbi:hypothetical protein [Youxingia wuxianensis]|uniref:Flagellar protein FlgN n=1 Tax=Youxingia wuxianensis TaxID=2763678 RepID=A0A926ENV9_9FIRM|nr:hypothetical protein [Youxingia wuxianensis]MBC8585800.1 hypothetical protein [Youxingia wuxianensis]
MQNFKKSLENYVTFLEEAAAGEKEKYTAVLSYDPKRIDRATSNQQAMNMRLAKMEEQREAEQKRVGLEGLTFHEILERLDAQERSDFEQLFRRFECAVDTVKYYNEKCLSFVQGGLQMLGVTEDALACAPYDADGKRSENAAGTSLFETKV